MAMFGYRPPATKVAPNPYPVQPLFADAPDSIAPQVGVQAMPVAPIKKGFDLQRALGIFGDALGATQGMAPMYAQSQYAEKERQRQLALMREQMYQPQHVGNNIVHLDRATGQYVTDYAGKGDFGPAYQKAMDLKALGYSDAEIKDALLPPQTVTTTDPTNNEVKLFRLPRGEGGAPPQASQGSPDVKAIMPHLIKQESDGRAGILGPQTRYGQAQGRTQMLPQTAQGVANRLGIPWRPDLMTGTSPEAATYQDALGQGYLQEGLSKTGNMRDALRYYHGGPDRSLWGPKTNNYADSVLRRAGQGGPRKIPSNLNGAPAGPAPGTTMGGYRFIGGNPNDRLNWQKVG